MPLNGVVAERFGGQRNKTTLYKHPMKLTVKTTSGNKKSIFPDKIIFTKKGVFLKNGDKISPLSETISEIVCVE